MPEKYLYTRTANKDTTYNVWVAFPECNSFALSSLGYLWIYKQFDEFENIFAERISTDTKKTKIKPQDVDMICFSFSFDMDYLNIFKILEQYNIPFKSKDRTNHPLICGGGPVLTTNPEPYKEFFDFIFIGDGEEVNLKATEICIKNKDKPKEEILKLLSKIEGIYVPAIHKEKTIKKVQVKLTNCVYTPILSDESFFSNTFIVEVSRGCYNRCGFCTASYINLPARFADYKEIIEKIDFGLQYTNKIALLGALVSAHPDFDKICKHITDKINSGGNIEMSISSLRADTITPETIQTLVKCGQKNITLALEASTERLRKVINKNITEEQLFNAIKISKDNGLKGVKIYAMLGLPTETEEDIEEFITLGKKLKKTFKNFDITFSFSTFVPKPHTPFQWSKREDTKSLETKQNYLKKEFHKIGLNSRFSSAKWDYYQTLLSRGNSELTDYLIEVYKKGGKLGAYKTCARQLNIDTEKYTTTGFDINKKLYWDFIEISPGTKLLKNEYNRLINKSIHY